MSARASLPGWTEPLCRFIIEPHTGSSCHIAPDGLVPPLLKGLLHLPAYDASKDAAPLIRCIVMSERGVDDGGPKMEFK
jgi:hypothetical protein